MEIYRCEKWKVENKSGRLEVKEGSKRELEVGSESRKWKIGVVNEKWEWKVKNLQNRLPDLDTTELPAK